MTEMAELERRITAALDRIGTGLDILGGTGAAAEAGAAAAAQEAEMQALREALEAEKVTNAQLEERVKSLHENKDASLAELRAQIASLKDDNLALKNAAIETKAQVQQLRKTNQHLQATLQNLRIAAAQGIAPHLINQAMMSELEGLHSVRDADRAELDDILGALRPLLKEAEDA